MRGISCLSLPNGFTRTGHSTTCLYVYWPTIYWGNQVRAWPSALARNGVCLGIRVAVLEGQKGLAAVLGHSTVEGVRQQ